MRSSVACGMAVILLYGASTLLSAQEDSPGSVDEAPVERAPGTYQQALAPYGTWVDDGTFGNVWRPPVDEDWQPYVDGSWAWTGDGWTWESDEPWGWTFHYGRWAVSPVFGWVWVPGDVWGPASVDWFWGDGFVGWAPLSPVAGATTLAAVSILAHGGHGFGQALQAELPPLFGQADANGDGGLTLDEFKTFKELVAEKRTELNAAW